ncbi:MAG: hypothetical protein II779_01915 [Clostridia bacterium]|nr:hypothetical protein [Clostridia bacterium]
MHVIINDPFIEFIRGYDRCAVRYCLTEDEGPHRGIPSHRDAVERAMLRAVEECEENKRRIRELWGKEAADRLHTWSCEIGRAKASLIDAAEFLRVPEILRTDRNGCVFYDCPEPDANGGPIPYWYAFLEPPHGSGYTPEDFRKVNAALFPAGTAGLEVCEWSTDWSDYFDAGHEWFGAACWSVWDRRMNRYAVLLVSATD